MNGQFDVSKATPYGGRILAEICQRLNELGEPYYLGPLANTPTLTKWLAAKLGKPVNSVAGCLSNLIHQGFINNDWITWEGEQLPFVSLNPPAWFYSPKFTVNRACEYMQNEGADWVKTKDDYLSFRLTPDWEFDKPPGSWFAPVDMWTPDDSPSEEVKPVELSGAILNRSEIVRFRFIYDPEIGAIHEYPSGSRFIDLEAKGVVLPLSDGKYKFTNIGHLTAAELWGEEFPIAEVEAERHHLKILGDYLDKDRDSHYSLTENELGLKLDALTRLRGRSLVVLPIHGKTVSLTLWGWELWELLFAEPQEAEPETAKPEPLVTCRIPPDDPLVLYFESIR